MHFLILLSADRSLRACQVSHTDAIALRALNLRQLGSEHRLKGLFCTVCPAPVLPTTVRVPSATRAARLARDLNNISTVGERPSGRYSQIQCMALRLQTPPDDGHSGRNHPSSELVSQRLEESRMLTPRLQDTLLWIDSYQRQSGGVSPSYKEIAAGLCLSKTTISRAITELESLGYIRTINQRARCIELIKPPPEPLYYIWDSSKCRLVPLDEHRKSESVRLHPT